MTYVVISKRQGALHIDGLEAATKPVSWICDEDKINEEGYVPYMAESACAAITRFGSFRFEHKKFEELTALRSYIETARQLHKICKRCDKALQALGN